MKFEKQPNAQTGHPTREKWERRFRGPSYLGDELPNMQQMIRYAQFGYGAGVGLPEIKKLHSILRDRQAIGEGESVALKPDHIIFQRRRRGRLELDEIEVLRKRVAKLEELEGGVSVPNRKLFLQHATGQLEAYEKVAKVLIKYTSDELGGECVLSIGGPLVSI